MRGEVEARGQYEEAFIRYRAALFLQYRRIHKAIEQSVAQPQGQRKSPQGGPESQPQEQPESSVKRLKREADQAQAKQFAQLAKEDRLRKYEAQARPSELGSENKYGIPEYEDGGPRRGWRPLGRCDRD